MTPATRMLDRMLELDVAVSQPIFRLTLPVPLECLLSVPGNLMGPPLIQVVGPLWIMVLLFNGYNVDGDFMTQPVVLAMAVVSTIALLFVPWTLFLCGQRQWILSRYFFSHLMFGICPMIGVCISNAYVWMSWPDSHKNHVTCLCFHFILLYNTSCIGILWLKHWTQRTRPACTVQHVSTKHFDVIPRTLARLGPQASFPSGDVMAATALAMTLVEGGGIPVAIPLSLVALTSFGRVYFLAHHVLDCWGGAAVAIAVHRSCSFDFILPRLGTAEWYHPLGAMVVLAVASRFRKSNEK